MDYSESGSTWTNLASGTGYTQNTNFISGAVFNPDKSYIIRLAVTDYFETRYAYYTLPTSASVLDFRYTKKGLAIGKASEKDAFEVAWPAEFNSVDFTMPNGRRAVYFPASNANDIVEEWALGSGGSNYPGSGFWYVHTIMYQNSNQRKQIAYGYQNNDVYTRHVYQGAWSAWVKTDGVTDRGVNDNGRYIRFSDGTQICWATKTSSATGELPWTFPAAFNEGSSISVLGQVASSASSTEYAIYFSGRTTTSMGFRVVTTSGQFYSTVVMLFAIGKWA